MAEITAALVKKLRDMTQLSMMDCKAALSETAGDFEKAVEHLNKKYKGKLEKFGDRVAGEGRVGAFVTPAGTTGGLVELRCETAPVAKNELFVELANRIAKAVAEGSADEPTPEQVLALVVDGKPVKDHIHDAFSRLQENMQIKRARKYTGPYVASYVHYDGRIGALVVLDAKPADEQVARDLCMHVAFAKPVAIKREQVPQADLDAYKAAVKEELVQQKKPEAMHEKIILGKLNSFYAERVLPEQEHSNPKYEKKSILASLNAVGVKHIVDLTFYVVGS